MTEILEISIGIAMTRPIALSLRDGKGHRIFKLPGKSREWESSAIKAILACQTSLWKEFKFESGNISINVKICKADSPRNYFFCCISDRVVLR
jgi:hypothetical protein